MEFFSYLAAFDVFPFGYIAVIQLVFFILLFTYIGLRKRTDKAGEKATSITLAAVLVLFISALLGFAPLLAGFFGIMAWSLASRHFVKMNNRDFAVSFIVLWIMLAIFSITDGAMRMLLLVFALCYQYLETKYFYKAEEKPKEKTEKKEEKKEEKKK